MLLIDGRLAWVCGALCVRTVAGQTDRQRVGLVH